MIDFNDSFVHTISSYLSEVVSQVDTVRYYNLKNTSNLASYDGFILSPGPKTPTDYPMKWLLDKLLKLKKPLLGICLGHQAIIEYFGGRTSVLAEPVHGKKGKIQIQEDSKLLKGLKASEDVARYHSLIASCDNCPDTLRITSILEDGSDLKIAMSVEHVEYPIFGIQFHPESILTSKKVGYKILENFINLLQPEHKV